MMREIFKRISFSVKSMSISRRMILYISLLLVVQMALIGYLSFNWTSDYLKDLYIKKIRETNYAIMQQVNYIKSNYESISDEYFSDSSIQEKLLTNVLNYATTQNIRSINQSLSYSNDEVYPIIAGADGIAYQSTSSKYVSIRYDKVVESDIYKQSKVSNGNNIWLSCNYNIITGEAAPFLYLCRSYISTTRLFKNLGQLIIQISDKELQQVFKESSLDAREYYAIVDSDGKYIYHTQDMSMMGKHADNQILAGLQSGVDNYKIVHSDKDDFLLSYSINNANGWSVIHVLPMDLIRSSARKAIDYVLIILLISMLISIPVLVLVLERFTKPIKVLKTAVERFGNGESEIRTRIDRYDEIGLLQKSFNNMAEKINEQMLKIEKDKEQQRLLEINMLEYQINPHFLYNSLDFINWMAQKSGNDEISEMVVALARFFRVGLSKGKEFYAVKDELDHVRQYLLINQLRFKDCFRFEIQADPDVLNYSTIKIILQPAVENAIKHGINKYNKDGFIRVSAKKEKEDILFEVSDNGTGIDKERLAVIQKMMANHSPIDEETGNGFGLYNVNMRIWMQFGDGYGVTLQNSEGSGTVVKINIPAIFN